MKSSHCKIHHRRMLMTALNANALEIGNRLRLARKASSLSLRGLSVKANVSPSNLSRIEKGGIEPSNKVLKLLLETLNINLFHDPSQNDWFDQSVKRFYSLLMYMRFNEAKKIYDSIIAADAYFKESTRLVEYNFFRYVAILNLRIDFSNLDYYHDLVTFMKAALHEDLKRLYIISNSIYLLLKSDFVAARDFLLSNIEDVDDPNSLGRMYYTIAFTLTNDYKYYHQALKHFKKSMEYFEETMNYERVNRCKAMQQVLFVYLHQFEAFKDSFEATKKYTTSVDNIELYYFTLVNQARYYIMKEDYRKTLDILTSFEVELSQYYFYKIFAYFRLGSTIEALNELKRFRGKQGILITNLDASFLETLEYGMTNGINDQYLMYCKNLVEYAHQKRDVLIIQMATSLYTEVLEEKRFYKEAHQVMEKFLHVLYKIQ